MIKLIKPTTREAIENCLTLVEQFTESPAGDISLWRTVRGTPATQQLADVASALHELWPRMARDLKALKGEIELVLQIAENVDLPVTSLLSYNLRQSIPEILANIRSGLTENGPRTGSR